MQPVDESYFKSAPQILSHSWLIAKPASEVWAELTSDTPLHWCKGLDKITWTSARPFGVGTTRRVHALYGAIRSDERYFIWEEGRRQAFYFTGSNLPLFKSFAEDYLVEPEGDGSCRFTWTIALTPTALGKPGGPLNKVIFGGLFRDTGRYFNAA